MMEPYEEDDDTHYCIKCHSTINGLDNYVRHRQSGCRPQEAKQSEVTNETPSTPTVTYPEILNADAFFSSLELQSSTKSNPPLRSHGRVFRKRKVGQVEEKGKKKVRHRQEPDDGPLKDKLLNMPPVVADLDDLMDHLGIPSLVGFPDIVTTTKSSAVPSGKSTAASSTKLNNQDNLSASPVESILANCKGSNERKRSDDPLRMEQDQGEWSDDTTLVDLDTNSENKEGDHGELTSDADSDYQENEESDGDSPDDDVDENESYFNDDETDDREFLPRGHTGGKWKPSGLLQDMSRLNENESVEDDDNLENPTPSHTGGKWKPADSSQRVEENELAAKEPGASSLGVSGATTGRQPTAGHTRGKWIPGAPGDFGSGYWCDPCGRKLASRLLYNRHLLSDLHARRSIQEIDGDLQLPRGVGPLLRRKSASKRQRALAEIKSRIRSRSQDNNKGTRKKTRRRQKEVLECEMCQARVRRPQMGKHLLSHYHCRVAGTNPSSNPTAHRFILENMSNVVRQCPFQCSICHFYCNTETTFLRHWRSTLHTSKSNDVGGSYKCNACNFYCHDNQAMEEHLTCSGHREVVAMMNGSVPIVVGRQSFLICETCNQHFRYNLQLRIHARVTGHSGSVTATDEYQSRIACGQCSKIVRSLVALQRHQLLCHARKAEIEDDEAEVIAQPSAPYFCSFCMMNFKTAHEAVLHRRTASHKEIVRAQKSTAENLSSSSRDCPHCGSKQTSLLEHKDHLLQMHPEMCHRCPRCGLLFALPQDVTRHTRDVECGKAGEVSEEKARIEVGEWKCTNCSFTTDSQAEYLFHDALHAGSIAVNTDEAGCSKTPAKFRCPMCEKYFCKATLRNHIRSHTGERPFRCIKCSLSFTRRSSLNMHRKECSTTWTTEAEDFASRRRNYACSECDAAFFTKKLGVRFVTYRETYKKQSWVFFKKTATRINYRRQTYWTWVDVNECCTGFTPLSEEPLTCVPECQSQCPGGQCKQPNVCECSIGYRNPTSQDFSTCVPNCDGDADDPQDCGDHGRCTGPFTCECDDGYTETGDYRYSRYSCEPKCEVACGEHSFCYKPNNCQCHAGYRLASLNESSPHEKCEPICDNECVNGVCLLPNVCSCNPGYKQHPTEDFLCEPVCNDVCINADCTKPDHCECHSGYEKNLMNPPEVCSPICDPPCINGECTQPNHCECYQGYETIVGHWENICVPTCNPPCINGTCTQPNTCDCNIGYGKSARGPDHECSPICDPPCINGECTQPNHCECHQRYRTDPVQLEVCLPVCDPPCTNAACIEPDTCECLDGHGKSAEGHSQVCLPICDPPCVNAECSRPNHCECHRGYELDPAGTIHQCSPVCDPPCTNAVCSEPNLCQCHDGYANDPKDPPQYCSPVCDPACDSNGFCDSPNKCTCNDGYIGAGSIANSTFDNNMICQPLCQPECIKNATCVSPDVCQCDPGYQPIFPSTQGSNPTQCLPICEKDCLNGFCAYPNQCGCNFGYTMNLLDEFTCDPYCEHDCINAMCTGPNYCECFDGYEKAQFVQSEPHHDSSITDNICIPGCPEDCLSCIDSVPNPSSRSCDPSCAFFCPTKLECLPPNQCQPPTVANQGNTESFTTEADVSQSTQHCPSGGNFLEENGTCTCKNGWSGPGCDQPIFCILRIMSDNETDNRFYAGLSDAIENNQINEETEYEEAAGMLGWQAPECQERCRISLLALDTKNFSDMIIHCHRQVLPIVVNDSPATEDPSLTFDANNASIVCFIKAESECSTSEMKISSVHGFLHGVSGGLASGIIVVTLLLVSLGSFIVIQKKRNAKQLQAASQFNSVTVKWHALKQHTMRHAGKNYKCGLPGCPTILRTENELRSHRRLVHETGNADRSHQCSECPYSAKTKTQLRRHQTRHVVPAGDENSTQLNCPFSHCNFATKITSHLRRHLRLHTGTKPYKCRHCSYASNNLENLRKHVLSTSLHPGKTIYECDVCIKAGSPDPYCTNFAKELRAHLLEVHPRDFPRPSDASDHVAKIFRSDGEAGSPTPNANNPYEDSITGQRHDHDYKC